MEKLLGLSLQASNAILISITCFCIVVLVFMLVYRKRKYIQEKHGNQLPEKPKKEKKIKKAKKEEVSDNAEQNNKDLLADIIAVHEQKQAEKEENEGIAQQEVTLKEVENLDDNNQ